MKKLILLIPCLLLSWNIFSQTDTAINNDPKPVHLTINQAQGAAKDAIKLDGCEQENKELHIQVFEYKNKVSQKDSLIVGYKKLDENNQFIIKNDSVQKETYKENESLFKKQIKQANTKKVFWFTTTLVTTAISIFLITKL